MRRGLRLKDLEATAGEFFDTYDGEGFPVTLFRAEGNGDVVDVTLLTLAAKRDAALRDVWHAFGVSTYRGIPVFVSGYLVPLADLPPRGMPNSEARKRREEREASLTCERCGHSGVGLFRMGQSTLCVSKPACDARLSAAKACLEPVTQV